MHRIRPFLAVFLTGLILSPAGIAQEMNTTLVPGKPQVPVAPGSGFINAFTRDFRKPDIAPVNLGNSPRLESLIRAGNLYLSLEDAIAVALENNLDIELSRYGPQIAQADYLRARAGGLLRGVPTAVRAGATSALSQAGGGGGQGTGGTGGTGLGGQADTGGTVITQTGVAVPNLDPVFFFASNYGHASRPQANTITTGLTALVFDSRSWQSGYQQSFLTGTTVSMGWNNNNVRTNNPLNDLNPNTSSNLQLQLTQRLLQGFGLAVNNRNIRVAQNNVRVSDLVFKQQVMTTIAGVVNLYWDLVSFNEDLKVRKQALDVAVKFYEDNKKQVEIGTLAPIEIVRAEARVAQAQQDLTNAETSLLQQETILKNALSRTGVASPTISEARVIPTDALTQPAYDTIENLSDLVERALSLRPDLQQANIQMDSTRIGIAGSRSQLLPSLDVNASFQNNALTGDINTVVIPGRPFPPRNPDPFFIGGYGNALAQLFRRNFPDYSVGFQLNIPINNRTARADYIRDQLQLRQQQLTLQRSINDMRVNVQNAQTALIQARARYEAAVKERQLQEQTLDAENKKYALGASTAFQVVQTQRDLAQAQASEVAALANYSRARVQLDLNTATILDKYGVNIADARDGRSSKPMASHQR
jgi:outer membrane protein